MNQLPKVYRCKCGRVYGRALTPSTLHLCTPLILNFQFFLYICIMEQDESKLQRHCVRYFRVAFPKYSGVFFSVPNGGYRNTIEASRLKAEGALAGVADLLLLVPSGKYNCLAIEMKTENGKQSERQKEFQENLTNMGGKYVVCRSFDDFKQTIDNYLINV